MTLRKFNADVAAAAQKAISGGVHGIATLARGDSDGEVVVKYQHESLHKPIRIQALAQNVDEYPDGNMFMLFTDDDDPPPPIVGAMQTVQDYLFGLRVYEMVTELSKRFAAALDPDTKDGHGAPSTPDQDEAYEDEGYHYDEDEEDDGYDSDGDIFGLPSSKPTEYVSSGPTKDLIILRQRLRRDLRLATQAGYKVGILDSLRHAGAQGIVSISIRVEKLALSEEAKEAWDLDDKDYVVLLVQFDTPYAPLERVLQLPSAYTRVRFRIGKCTKYKPSRAQALAAFTEHEGTRVQKDETGPVDDFNPETEFRKLFISNSLDQFLNESFISLVKLRDARKYSWDKANEELRSKTGFGLGDDPNTAQGDTGPYDPMEIDLEPEDHRILVSDHMTQSPDHGHSFPLIAMEFAMHYFVRCTEYCLRCHRRLEKGFEALRPYVCSDPLCLFQYMAMGFGPSIEHEILTEPYVVDLLVSLCYSAVQPGVGGAHVLPPPSSVQGATASAETPSPVCVLPIRELPLGLPLRVPSLDDPGVTPLQVHSRYDHTRLCLADPSLPMDDRLCVNRWIAFRSPNQQLTRHAVILEIDSASRSFIVKVMGESAANWSPTMYGMKYDGPAPGDAELADVYIYDTDFDSLDDRQKGGAMRHILDTLPSIPDIAVYLRSNPHCSLRSMDRISPAAASLLQWIVSSNRSCIFQVEASEEIAKQSHEALQQATRFGLHGQYPVTGASAGEDENREHERIPGMKGWIQFRFAQGSPDKELRFKRSLQEVAARKFIEQNPTIFAWHGSNLANWHSIVRSGLDFNEIKTGRAYGHGVYFSNHFQTSMGYAHGGGLIWGNSALKFTTCMSLNEIINATDEFVSRSPHYVVAQPDWHQCRYLLVKATTNIPYRSGPNGILNTTQSTTEDEQDSTRAFHTQAPGLEVLGPDSVPLKIPLAAIPFRRVGGAGVDLQSTASKRNQIQRMEDESSDEDKEDVEFLVSDGESDTAAGPPHKKHTSRSSSVDTEVVRDMYASDWSLQKTHGKANMLMSGAARPLTPANTDKILGDFEPGALDLSGLTTLEPPAFANDFATRALARELKKLQEVQKKTALHELGWYIDFNQVANLFQWIVEFHSFDLSLPLAQDMKAAGVPSVVFEIRFGKDYPMSPPFVRVIRPRFLPFMEGGGGHVTAGGAMCMELLTHSGWSPANSMESVLLQVRMAISALEPKPARLKSVIRKAGVGVGLYGNDDYRIGEAVEAFIRAANVHGWRVPDDLRSTATGMVVNS
ncbi:hypothetical protein B0H66DRAFT_482027 [Apodospora peruviana]|uniref:UBC core domain-containing protein n=1 Tax=Apodospora peruviana TaxID=516989 RepID=A0AAE0HY79_9PEZI|nr:hypothetical protein B0H66DRAFT_482027 [Apodospora peruviana]